MVKEYTNFFDFHFFPLVGIVFSDLKFCLVNQIIFFLFQLGLIINNSDTRCKENFGFIGMFFTFLIVWYV